MNRPCSAPPIVHAAIIIAVLLLAGCDSDESGREKPAADMTAKQDASAVTVYCSVDEPLGRSVLDAYESKTGAKVSAIFDSEAGKTTGLVNRIRSEAGAGRPRADVFWSSEIFNTILLGREGLLDPYDSPAAKDIPARYRNPDHYWTALAVRGRVVAFDPTKVKPDAVPARWEELAGPTFAPQTAFANPLFGTTRGHVAAMYALWGPDRAKKFLTDLRDNGVHLADGNSATVRAVMAGQAAFACTDTDDVWVAQRGGASLDLAYLDMGDGGTLLIPCSVAIIKGGPNAGDARALVDFLVSAEVERMLAESDSRNVPVRESLRAELNLTWPPETKVDFAAVADAMEEAVAAARDILLR
jgi:iron(III) transport system substrate-binding protein